MAEYDSENDWLDELYARTKHEQAPKDLDDKIILQAKDQVATYRKASIFQWQRIASVAAVMVFSIYLFFDVKELQQDEFAPEILMPQAKKPALDMPLDLEGESPSRFQSIEPSLMSDRMLEQSEDAVAEDLPVGAQPSVVAPKLKSEVKKQILPQKSKVTPQPDEFAAESAPMISEIEEKTNQDAKRMPLEMASDPARLENAKEFDSFNRMIAEIRALIASGDSKAAKARYEELIVLYPHHEIPEDVKSFIENSSG